jgi:hypothetical protein
VEVDGVVCKIDGTVGIEMRTYGLSLRIVCKRGAENEGIR